MPQYRGLVRTPHKTVTVTSVSVTGLRSSRTRANKLVSIVSRFFWLVLSNLISLSRSWERKNKKHFSLHSSLDCSRERWVSHRGRSLRRKRFSVVSEQKENEERRGTGLSVFAGRKMGREPKMKEVGRGNFFPFFPTPSPFFYSPHFLRGLLTLIPCSLLRNGTETLATQTTGPGLGGD